MFKRLCPFLITLIVITSLRADELSLYKRCYEKFTNSPLPLNSIVISKIKKKKLKARDACLNLLRSATLQESGKLKNPTQTGKKILNQFVNLNYHWLTHKRFRSFGKKCFKKGTEKFFSPDTPSKTLVRSLLQENLGLPYAFQNGPHIPSEGQWIQSWYGQKEKFLSNRSFGGGILGSPEYLLLTGQGELDFKSDQKFRMPRKFAWAFFKDFLCQDFPSLPEIHPISYWDKSSPLPFVSQKSCAHCHASMDPLAKLIDHIQYTSESNNCFNNERPSGIFVQIPKFNQTKLNYKNYKHKVFSLPISSLSDLGKTLSKQEQVFYCFGKRYYQWFLDKKLEPKKAKELTIFFKQNPNLISLFEFILKEEHL